MKLNNMHTPLFSILIAQYNNGKYFEDCYKSIIAQTYTNWEAIIVDDCSTDDSVEQMKKLIGADARFKIYLNEENRGCGYTKRRCAGLAAGVICGFLDPDDAIIETAVSEMVNKHIEFPNASLIYSNFFPCDENLIPIGTRRTKIVTNYKIEFFNLNGYVTSFSTYKKELYFKTLGIDEYLKRAVDQDLYLKMYEVGPVFLIDKTLYYYRIHKNGISSQSNAAKAKFWHWVVIIGAAKRRNVNIENIFINENASPRENALELEISSYNRSLIFKILRKLGFFKI